LKLVTAMAGGVACAKEAPPAEAPSTPEARPSAEVHIPPPAAVATEASPVVTAAPASTVEPAPVSRMDDFDPKAKHGCNELRCPLGHPFAEGMKVLLPTCRTIEARLSPPRFQRFMQCMLRQNNTRNTCDLMLISTDPDGCLEGWASPKEIDPRTAATCAPIVQKCARTPARGNVQPLTTEACQRIMSVTRDTPAARKKMIDCTTEYCGQAASLCHGGYG
jgi:hypothetical protein